MNKKSRSRQEISDDKNLQHSCNTLLLGFARHDKI